MQDNYRGDTPSRVRLTEIFKVFVSSASIDMTAFLGFWLLVTLSFI